MNNLTVAEVDADVTMLLDNISSGKRNIPSLTRLLKICIVIPSITLLLSLLSDVVGYLSLYDGKVSVQGYFDYFSSDGWAVVMPTAIVGMLFAFMTYNNLMMYMTVPDYIRRKSAILTHLKSVAQRTVISFLLLIAACAILAGFSPWFSVAIPVLEFALLFTVNLVVSAEINRLGAGIALEKISKLISKI